MTASQLATDKTVTERELFRCFLRSTITRQSNYGSIERIDVEECLREGGSEGHVYMDANRVADELATDDDPLLRLDREIEDREAHLRALRLVRDEFEAFQKWHAIEDDSMLEERYRKPFPLDRALANPPHGSRAPDGADLLTGE